MVCGNHVVHSRSHKWQHPPTVKGVSSTSYENRLSAPEECYRSEVYPVPNPPMANLNPVTGTSAELKKLLTKYPSHCQRQKTLRDRSLEAPKEGAGASFMFLAQANLHNDLAAKDYLQNLLPGSFVSLGANQSHLFSRGTSHAASANPSDPPRIDPRYLSHPLDIELLARHVQFLEKLARSAPLSDYLKPEGKRNHHTAYVDDLDTAKDYVRTTVISNYHPVGTCVMLPKADSGVVNNSLRVYGQAMCGWLMLVSCLSSRERIRNPPSIPLLRGPQI